MHSWWHPEGAEEPKDWDEKTMTQRGAYMETEDTFHIGQSYEKKPAKVLACRTCGGRIFEVAQGSYFTAIKCVACKWESCVHEG